MSAGKGSRPRKVNKEKYDKNYDAIFRKHKCPNCYGHGSFQEGGTLSRFVKCDYCDGKGYINDTFI